MAGGDRDKALDAALLNIEKQYGKGSVMRLGDETRAPLEVIPTGSISLGKDVAHGWWIRRGNRIYLPANALGEEWLVRHEMLHALMERGSHPNDMYVSACHLASIRVWRDSTLAHDPGNPEGR